MDEPGWVWPAWKFGFKRDDLNTTLSDQYNTFSCTIQDPEAFHHDVYEISNEADTPEDFHRLMALRQQQRLKELNDSLESAAVEIIANPDLIGTEKWRFAVQVFRTRSLDALVRYFSSYLPDHLTQSHSSTSSSPPSMASSTYSSFSDSVSVDTASTKATDEDGDQPFFANDPDAVLTHEPIYINTDIAPVICADSASTDDSCPSLFDDPSDHSETSESPPASHLDAMSYSGSDSEHFPHNLSRTFLDDEDLSQLDDIDTPITTASDSLETRQSLHHLSNSELFGKHHLQYKLDQDEDRIGRPPSLADSMGHDADDETLTFDEEDDVPTAQLPIDNFDIFDRDTPTPRQKSFPQTSYISSTTISTLRSLPSPCRASKHRHHRREGSPVLGIRRSREETVNRVQKLMPDALRPRPSLRSLERFTG
jgi:hypothetical protein